MAEKKIQPKAASSETARANKAAGVQKKSLNKAAKKLTPKRG
jgi:hypothetical protein